MQLYTDRSFVYPYFKSIANYLKYADLETSPMNLYKFSYKGPFSFSLLYTNTFDNFGVVHLDDQLYLFPVFPNSYIPEVTQTMIKFYVDFAVSG